MSAAIATHSTQTSRRDVFYRFGLASLVGAGLATAAAAPSGDEDLIAICAELIRIGKETDTLLGQRRTLEEEARAKPALDALYLARLRALGRLERHPQPKTTAGVAALGKVAIALHDDRGSECESHRIALSALEALIAGVAQ